MSDEGCLACVLKDVQIFYLQAEVNRLELENQVLKEIIKKAHLAAIGIIGYSDRTMANGGLPRGTWSLLKGRRDAAIEISDKLR